MWCGNKPHKKLFCSHLLMDKATLIALQLRFSNSYTNKREMVHKLPNGLFVVTIDPSFAQKIDSIEPENIEISANVSKGECICRTDKGDIKSPVSGTVIDVNSDICKCVNMFRSGPTSSFIVMIKPDKCSEPLENEDFEKLF